MAEGGELLGEAMQLLRQSPSTSSSAASTHGLPDGARGQVADGASGGVMGGDGGAGRRRGHDSHLLKGAGEEVRSGQEKSSLCFFQFFSYFVSPLYSFCLLVGFIDIACL